MADANQAKSNDASVGLNPRHPRVSVIMITYKHEEFVAQAIDGVLSQQTRFAFELIIGDDASPDRTREVIQGYADKHSDVIRLNYPLNNLGAIRNFATQIDEVRGEYIAFCEGDDWWTDPYKLQLQVDFLDSNIDCALCHHRVSYFDNDMKKVVCQFPADEFREDRLSGDLLIRQNFIQTCALMVRRSALPHLPNTFWKLKLGDWPLCVLVARQGLIGYLDRDMSMFRLHGGGTWSTRSAEQRNQAVTDMGKFLLTQFDAADRKAWAIFTLNFHAAAVGHAVRERSILGVLRESMRLFQTCFRYYPKAIPYNIYRMAKTIVRPPK